MIRSELSKWPLVVVDWGTTNLRNYLVDAEGSILSSQSSADGVKSIAEGAFPDAFARLMHPFGPDRPALLVGMIGSQLGWIEVPVHPAPISPDALSANLFPVPNTNALIVPGISARSLVGAVEMMRGEETQALGAMAAFGLTDGIICLPGTHSKWLSLQNGKVSKITTAMTGEIFELLSTSSVLRHQIEDEGAPHDPNAFNEGLELARTGIGAVQLAFSTRPRSLVAGCQNAYSYLSGILIGAEIEAISRTAQIKSTVIVAAPKLGLRYATACDAFGIQHKTLSSAQAVALGAAHLWQSHLNHTQAQHHAPRSLP